LDEEEEEDSDEEEEENSSVDSDDSDDVNKEWDTPAVIQIAAKASVFLINKYMELLWDCDLYIVVIGEFSILLIINGF